MQWEHPELTAAYQAIQNRYHNIKFASYRIALKLRSIQKKIQSLRYTHVHVYFCTVKMSSDRCTHLHYMHAM